jgi:hypothetical protein
MFSKEFIIDGSSYDLRTGQEHNLMGSSSGTEHKEIGIQYIPIAVLGGRTIEEINNARNREIGYLNQRVNGMLGRDIRLYGHGVLSYEPLDATTGQTTRDPQVLGFYRMDIDFFTPAEPEDTEDFYIESQKRYDVIRDTDDKPYVEEYFIRTNVAS